VFSQREHRLTEPIPSKRTSRQAAKTQIITQMNSLIGYANPSVTRFGPPIIRGDSMSEILCSRLLLFASLRLRVKSPGFVSPAAFERPQVSGGSPFTTQEIRSLLSSIRQSSGTPRHTSHIRLARQRGPIRSRKPETAKLRNQFGVEAVSSSQRHSYFLSSPRKLSTSSWVCGVWRMMSAAGMGQGTIAPAGTEPLIP
jgi:hypothetical protein